MNRSLLGRDKWFVVVSYDIKNDRRRNRVCKELKNFGEHIQFSVFECLLDEKEITRLERKLGALIDEEEDTVRIYLLCNGCRMRTKVIGTGELTGDLDVVVV